MATLKNELVRGDEFLSEADARTELFDFIESYDNGHRRHLIPRLPNPSRIRDQPGSRQLRGSGPEIRCTSLRP